MCDIVGLLVDKRIAHCVCDIVGLLEDRRIAHCVCDIVGLLEDKRIAHCIVLENYQCLVGSGVLGHEKPHLLF